MGELLDQLGGQVSEGAQTIEKKEYKIGESGVFKIKEKDEGNMASKSSENPKKKSKFLLEFENK